MKKTIRLAFLMLFVACGLVAHADYPISKVDRVQPNDMIFMDMAVGAARSSVAKKGKPCGAVLILNGAFNATGMPSATKSAEEDAISKGRGKMSNAVLYTVNEPTSAAYIAICVSGVGKVVFANPKDAVIASGVATAADYEEVALPEGVKATPMVCIDFTDAATLLK